MASPYDMCASELVGKLVLLTTDEGLEVEWIARAVLKKTSLDVPSEALERKHLQLDFDIDLAGLPQRAQYTGLEMISTVARKWENPRLIADVRDIVGKPLTFAGKQMRVLVPWTAQTERFVLVAEDGQLATGDAAEVDDAIKAGAPQDVNVSAVAELTGAIPESPESSLAKLLEEAETWLKNDTSSTAIEGEETKLKQLKEEDEEIDAKLTELRARRDRVKSQISALQTRKRCRDERTARYRRIKAFCDGELAGLKSP